MTAPRASVVVMVGSNPESKFPTAESAGPAKKGPSSWIVRVGMAGEPMRVPVVYALDDLDRVTIGRQEPDETMHPERIATPDRWMSAEHAEILKTAEGWRLSDVGSSNGTLLWGQRTSTALLSDGDVFETGSTFWLFRSHADGRPVESPTDLHTLTSVSPKMLELLRKLERVAKSGVPLVLRGETGVGKEVLARAAHTYSGRRGRLTTLDAGTVPPHLVSVELFGVAEAGGTGERPRLGRLRAADGGTVLLDQLADMSNEVQVALLRVLQSGEITPIGSDEPMQVDLRFVATTHDDIGALAADGRFRTDLWSRLRGFEFEVPALRDRLEDVGVIVANLLRQIGMDALTFSPRAYRALLVYPWPNNIRELAQAIEAAGALSDGQRIELTDLPPEVQSFEPDRGPTRPSEESRERELVRLLGAHKGNVSAVARSMGYSRMQVHRWMKQMSVDPNDYRV